MKASLKQMFFLAAVMFAVFVFVSCESNNKEQTSSPEKTQSNAVETTEYVEYPELPINLDYDGYKFTILVTANPTNGTNPFVYTDTALVLDNAVYQRNTTVEENYGIQLNIISEMSASNTGDGPGTRRLIKNASSGDSEYDSCLLSIYDVSKLAYQNYLFNLIEAPYISLDKSWWDKKASEDLTINGKLFYTTGDISYNDKEYTFCVIFNKEIARAKKINDLYTLAGSGKWTYDIFSEYTKTVSEDLNGDDKFDSRDKYGLMIWDDTILAMITAAGVKSVSVGGDSKLELTIYNDRAVTIIEKFVGLSKTDYCINFQHMSGGGDWMEMFRGGQVLFLLEYFKALSSFRDYSVDYGILPFPKLDETQGSYYSGISVWHASLYCIPSVVKDEEVSGIISEALAYYSSKSVTPAYYEKTLVGRQIRDDESEGMLDIIFANRTFDMGLFYRVGLLNSVILNLVRNGQTDFASQYASVEQAAKKDIGDINNYYLLGNK